MNTVLRPQFIASFLAFAVMTGCTGGSGNPGSPSGGAGATIAGTVNRSAETVTVASTSLSAAVDGSGHFQIGGVPTGNVQLKFKGAAVDATAQVSNVAPDEFIEIQVLVNGGSATILNESRSAGKVSLCHATGNGEYHLIDISVNAEPAHRAHGDAKVGEPVPGQPDRTFDSSCRPVGPAVDIRKFTNGEDADTVPGPSIVVGNPITWEYRVTNTGTVNLTGIKVADDHGVAVNCSGQTTLAPAATMTCSGTGVATLGQYGNVGTVTANWATGGLSGTVTASNPSHYLGVSVTSQEEGPKVTLCHKTGAGFYVTITVSTDAEPAHRAHGDGKPGEAVPGLPGKVFTASCGVR